MTNEERQYAIEWFKHRPVMMAGAKRMYDMAVEALEGKDTNVPSKEEAIPVDWIRNYINDLKAMGVQLSLRDAQAVSVMVDKYMMEQNGNTTCGPDYCEIGGTHNE